MTNLKLIYEFFYIQSFDICEMQMKLMFFFSRSIIRTAEYVVEFDALVPCPPRLDAVLEEGVVRGLGTVYVTAKYRRHQKIQ